MTLVNLKDLEAHLWHAAHICNGRLFLETRPESTPKLIGDVVEQIDKIVKAKRFKGWQSSNSGPREIQKALLLTLAQFGLGKDKELFAKAYGYIEEHY